MATLERIRRRSGLLIIVIGLAMLAFILTDLFSSGDSILRGEQNKVGEVNGTSVDYQEFTQRVDERLAMLQRQNQQMANISRIAVADQIWSEILREEILGERYEKLGISVTNEELVERVRKNPQINNAPNLKDPVTGKFSIGLFKDYLENIKSQAASDPEAADMYEQWLAFEKSIYDNALEAKYRKAIQEGFYMPEKLARQMYDRREANHVVQFFGLEYNSIADSAVSYSESDLRKYFSKNESDFKFEESRDLAFVTFRVDASKKDIEALKAELRTYLQPEVVSNRGRTDTLPSFYTAENDSAFAVARSDEQVRAEYLTKEQLPAPLDSILFDKEPGFIYGPYEDRNTLALTKVSNVKMLPDSVQARHILISYQGANQGQSQSSRPPQQAQALADSLFKVYKEDTTGFAAAARQFSDDPGSGSKGGDLGWFTRDAMVKPFGNFAFLNETGDVGMVFTQFGFHIIHIQDQKGANRAVKLVNIRREVLPSDATRDSVYNAASAFASAVAGDQDFATAAANMGYSPRPVTDVKPMQEQLLGIGENREIVRWAYDEETQAGDIDLFNNNNQSYVVATLTRKRSKGVADLDEVKDEVTAAVIRQKKAQMLTEKINENKVEGDLAATAQKLDKSLTTQGITFATSNLTGYGSEPKVIGYATGMEVNAISNPVEGDRAVYMLKLTGITPGEQLQSYDSEQARLDTEMQNLATNKIFETLKEGAQIEDNRARFF